MPSTGNTLLDVLLFLVVLFVIFILARELIDVLDDDVDAAAGLVLARFGLL
jgi:hypothetical protein